jgi:DNA-binding XRE family transcriptional regulator
MQIDYPIEQGIVQIPLQEFETLQARLEELENITALDQALATPQEFLPEDIAVRLIEGESPVKVFREFRGLTQDALACKIAMTKTTISEIETGRKEGSVKTLSKIAVALDVTINDLIDE